MKVEEELIEQAKLGDQMALALLLQNNYSFLVNYLLKVTLNQDLAYDLAQDTMVKCIEKIKLYNGTSKFSSWLITIATNLYIDQKRKKKREERYQEQEQYLRKMRWHYAQSDAEWTDMMDALGRMSEEIRVPIIMKHYYGFTLEEIATMLNIPLGTVKSRLHNGLKNIRKELTDYEEKEFQPIHFRARR